MSPRLGIYLILSSRAEPLSWSLLSELKFVSEDIDEVAPLFGQIHLAWVSKSKVCAEASFK
jgi:hypothetical protein